MNLDTILLKTIVTMTCYFDNKIILRHYPIAIVPAVPTQHRLFMPTWLFVER